MIPAPIPGNERLPVSCRDFLAYLRLVDAAPFQPIDEPLVVESSAASVAVHPALLDELWRESGADKWALSRSAFDQIILLAAIQQNFGLETGAAASHEQQAAFFRNLKLADLVLAKACAAGNDRAWEHFIAQYGAQLTRAAIAITGSETLGRDLADAFYGELYGLTERDGKRRCPLESYRGRGSLSGWLRTTLSQRFVDHYRRTFREQSLDEQTHDTPNHDSVPEPESAVLLSLREALYLTLRDQPAEERFLLASYYVDEKTLAEIAQVLRVHEATISRRLRRATEMIRKRLLRNLEKAGMSRARAEEALGTDPRDLDLKMDLKKLLQNPTQDPFLEQARPTPAATAETIAREFPSANEDPLSEKNAG